MASERRSIIPPRFRVEICLEAGPAAAVRRDVAAVLDGGAAAVELCAAMDQDGLTPSAAAITAARQTFGERPGLMVMIRPRGGDFTYAAAEIALMAGQIEAAAAAGATGIVLGLVRGGQVDREPAGRLISLARGLGLQVTFHRAFDAVGDRLAALETLAGLGVDRILTAGVPWGSGRGAEAGIDEIAALAAAGRERVEWVIGGGIDPAAAGRLRGRLLTVPGKITFHAFSAVRRGGRVDRTAVAALVDRATGGSGAGDSPDRL